ncbi:Xaa-Pro dipeptidyl-peptidase [Microbacterium sp. NPDC055910]|uniref:Xaa-Pro dipeptidyl-peptidase n=1 Tax=Microbacterium sp. NPDC055910 TaxID=3345659 RepID=UPI0035D7DE19
MQHSTKATARRRALAVGIAVPAVACSLVLAANPANADTATTPTFVDGMAQAVFTTDRNAWIREEAWVESEIDSDGDGKLDLIHIDVTRVPETANGLKVPVVFEISPYYAGGGAVENWSVDHELGAPPTSKPGFPAPREPRTSPKISSSHEATWVPRGFAVVHAEGMGSGFSEGCPTTGGVNETLAGKAVVDWLNGRAKGYTSMDRSQQVTADWTTGSVGMMGTSYNGTLPTAVATTGVEGLDAIVPIAAISNWYEYYRSDGAVRAPGGYQGEDADVLADYVHTRPDQATCQPVIDQIRAEQDRVTGDYNGFWDERNYLNDVDKIKAATLVTHGLNDRNVMMTNASDLYTALKKTSTPHQIYLHQGGHTSTLPADIVNRWFTRYLFKHENGVESMPKATVQREDRVNTPYANWPDVAAADVTLNFHAADVANGVGTLAFGTERDAVTETIIDDASLRTQALAAAAESPNRLVYQTNALTDSVRFSGTPRVSLDMAVDREKANLSAALVEYPANGAPKIITRGWMDVQNRESAARTDAIVPGEFNQFTFAFEPHDYVFPAGSKIGVVVTSSDNEFTVRPAPGTKLTVDPSGSSLTLPVVGGAQELLARLGASGPGTDHQVITTEVEQGTLSLTVTSDEPVVLESVALTGIDQTTTGALHPVDVLDARGTAAGWDLTAQMSDFTSGTGSILGENLGWTPNARAADSDLPTDGSQNSVVTPGAPAAPGTGIGDSATLCASAAGHSAGSFTCGADLVLGVPGSTRVGTYSGVLTLTLI